MEIKQFSLQGNKYFSLFLAPSPLSPPSLFLLLSLSHCLALSLTLSLFLPSLSLSHTFSFFSPSPISLYTPLCLFPLFSLSPLSLSFFLSESLMATEKMYLIFSCSTPLQLLSLRRAAGRKSYVCRQRGVYILHLRNRPGVCDRYIAPPSFVYNLS